MKTNKAVEIVSEIIVVGGFLMLGYGLFKIYPPAMYVVCGLMLMYVGKPKGEPRNGPDK